MMIPRRLMEKGRNCFFPLSFFFAHVLATFFLVPEKTTRHITPYN